MRCSPKLLEVAAASAELQISSRMNLKYSPAAVPRVLTFVVVYSRSFYEVIMKNFEAGCTGAPGSSQIYTLGARCSDSELD
jgi:hypothetical protein